MLEQDTTPLDFQNFDLRKILDRIEILQVNNQNLEARINTLEQNLNENINNNNINNIQNNNNNRRIYEGLNILLIVLVLPVLLIFVMQNFSGFVLFSNTNVNKNFDDNALLQKYSNLQEQYQNLYQKIDGYSKKIDVVKNIVLTQQNDNNNMQIQVNDLKENLKIQAIQKIKNFTQIQEKFEKDVESLSKGAKIFTEQIYSINQKISTENLEKILFDKQNSFQASLEQLQNEQQNFKNIISQITNDKNNLQIQLNKLEEDLKTKAIQKIEHILQIQQKIQKDDNKFSKDSKIFDKETNSVNQDISDKPDLFCLFIIGGNFLAGFFQFCLYYRIYRSCFS